MWQQMLILWRTATHKWMCGKHCRGTRGENRREPRQTREEQKGEQKNENKEKDLRRAKGTTLTHVLWLFFCGGGLFSHLVVQCQVLSSRKNRLQSVLQVVHESVQHLNNNNNISKSFMWHQPTKQTSKTKDLCCWVMMEEADFNEQDWYVLKNHQGLIKIQNYQDKIIKKE